MLNVWNLPRNAVIGGKSYGINADFRDILEIFGYLDDPDLPDFLKWRIALSLFYTEALPPKDRGEGMTYFTAFVTGGAPGTGRPAPKLLCWQHDASVIIGEVNRVAGREIRELPFVHWWTFLSWFHAVGEGQLSFLVSLRDKLRRGEKLAPWEEKYYRENPQQVELPKSYTQEELSQRKRLLALLDGEKEQVK